MCIRKMDMNMNMIQSKYFSMRSDETIDLLYYERIVFLLLGSNITSRMKIAL